MAGYFDDPALIRRVPVLRAAYSDRTAWLLAEIARLVYEKLPAEIRVDELVLRILESARSQRGEAVVRALVAAAIENGQTVDGVVVSALETAGFDKVRAPLQAALARHPGVPLYITGHSLGGALALVATRYLGSDSTGANYFGCPRAGDDAFFAPIRTPIYRIVNAADGVTRIPFGYSLVILLSLIRLIPINGTFQIAEFLRRNFFGYTHAGSVVFLSDAANIPDGQQIPFRELKVVMSPEAFWRFCVVVRRFLLTRGKAVVADHSMGDYALKLQAHARRRHT